MKKFTVVIFYNDGYDESGVLHETGKDVVSVLKRIRKETKGNVDILAAFEGHHQDVSPDELRSY